MEKLTRNIEVYIANDGAEFTSETECESYEFDIQNVKFFKVKADYGLDEHFKSCYMIAVESDRWHLNIVTTFVTKELGYPILSKAGKGYINFHGNFEIEEVDRAEWDKFRKNGKTDDAAFLKWKERYLLAYNPINGLDGEFFNYYDKWDLCSDKKFRLWRR